MGIETRDAVDLGTAASGCVVRAPQGCFGQKPWRSWMAEFVEDHGARLRSGVLIPLHTTGRKSAVNSMRFGFFFAPRREKDNAAR